MLAGIFKEMRLPNNVVEYVKTHEELKEACLKFQMNADEQNYPGWTGTRGAVQGRQAVEAWVYWKAGMMGDVSLPHGVIEYAKTHEQLRRAFLTLHKDADQFYPEWKDNLGYTSRHEQECSLVSAGGSVKLD